MNHILLIVFFTAAAEVLIRLRFLTIISSSLIITKKAAYTITNSHMSDHWKEKVIPIYAIRLMKHSLHILFILTLLFSLAWIMDFFARDFLDFLISVIGGVQGLAFGLIYIYLRKRFCS